MKTLYDPTRLAEVRKRLARLDAGSARQWGKMNVSQMVTHCALGTEMALGEVNPPRMVLGRVLGVVIKPLALKDDAPMRKNSPTVPCLVVKDAGDLDREKVRLRESIERFSKSGAKGCTSHPHPFFGRMTPDEWAVLMYKHVDHHLRQFGV
jgi:hypothetical protein